jgi:hypothetical protein
VKFVIDQEQYPHPHCNAQVLHAPGDCHYCDMYPNQQAERKASNTPFTPLEANGWSGNVAVKAGERHEHLGASYIVGEPAEKPRRHGWIARLLRR